MCESLPSIEITTYTEEDVKEKASLLPQLKSIDGTAKCHEVTMIPVVNGEYQMVMKENSDQEPFIFKFVYEKKTTKVTKVAYSKNVKDTSESEDDDNSDKDYDNNNDSEHDNSNNEIDEDDSDVELIKLWKSLNPPTKEADLLNRWFGAIFTKGKKSYFYIGKARKRFLHDEGGVAASLELDCLRPHVGNSTILKSYPEKAHKDICIFQIHDIITVAEVIPLLGTKWEVPNYALLEELFKILVGKNQKQLYDTAVTKQC